MRNIFVAPFDFYLWLTMILTWTAIICVMMFLSWITTKISDFCEDDHSFQIDAIMWAIGAMCQKGWPRCPTQISMRIVFICGCLSGLLIYVAYSATIVSVLSVKHVPIKEFVDLIPYKYEFYVHEKSATLKDFLRDDVINNTKYNLTQGIITTDTANEVDRMISSQSAFLSFKDVFYSAAMSLNKTDSFICQTLSSLPVNSFRGLGSAMFLRKGSQYTETFNHKIMMMKERGLNHRYLREYRSKTEANCETTTVKTLRLNAHDVFIAFLVILSGIGTSFLIYLVEKLISNYYKSSKLTSSFFYRQNSKSSFQ